MAKRLREVGGPPQLGHNLHILKGHQRLDFVKRYHKEGKFLDAACGEGAFSLWAQQTGNDVWALDINDVGSWPQRYGINFKRTSLEEYEPHMKFDTILFMEIVEHLEEPIPIIEKLFGALTDLGVLLITTPHVPDWDWEEDHLWRWTHEEFVDMIVNINSDSAVWSDDIFLYAVLQRMES